ncbi:MAG TPA: ferrous iron transport protein B [Dehalococcoidales bacterium]|nr:ferrous iron transport protein B [Dehalococcoidales bacterium]
MSGTGSMVIALAGNPNCGKTTVFNNLTGARQHVGNWPGKTVEKKEGRFSFAGREIQVVDLPGAYSLGAYSEDEIIARDYILHQKPDTVVNVLDATNLDRNLYLTIQMLEMGAGVVLALNMYDEVKAKQIKIDIHELARRLGIAVIPTTACHNEGMKDLINAVISQPGNDRRKPLEIDYGREVEAELNTISQFIKTIPDLADKFSPRWLAIKILEGDENIWKVIGKHGNSGQLVTLRDAAIKRLEDKLGEDVASLIAGHRYEFISQVLKGIVVKPAGITPGQSFSDKLDRVLTHRFLGIPLFLLAMFAVFNLTFALGSPLADWVDRFFAWLGGVTGMGLAAISAPAFITSLVVDGIIGGVGSVIVFLPNILLLFLSISILEDSGYMARAAYIMDRFMHKLGLHGKSFIPLILGFGCNVPAIMATRTLGNRNDRLITILINPLMSCTARLPVYVLFAGAFFTANQGVIIFSLYLLGIVLAILMGMLFKKFVFKGGASHFIMELPPYRLPTLRSTLTNMWDRGSLFLRKMATIILAVVILVWILSNLPFGVEYASQESILGRIGSFIAPVFTLAGFGFWEAGIALLFGILAKEVVVGTLGVVYGIEEAGLSMAIAGSWTALSAYSFMTMTLIYIPCIASIAAIKRETNSWKWTFFAIGYSLLLGWTLAVLIFQAGRLLGLG